jgi:hypothetical protein
MINQQKNFIERTKLDHFVNLLYGHLVTELYKSRIQWNAILEKKVFPIDKDLMKQLDPHNNLPYTGTYQLEIARGKTKPKIKSDDPNPVTPEYFIHLLNLKITFKHTHHENEKKREFIYQIALVQRVSAQTAPTSTEEE